MGQKYQQYLRTADWQIKRTLCFRSHGRECSICGDPKAVEVHHLAYRNLTDVNPVQDLRPVCKPHHELLHKLKNEGWNSVDAFYCLLKAQYTPGKKSKKFYQGPRRVKRQERSGSFVKIDGKMIYSPRI